MRALFGVLGLIIVLAIVGTLVKKQLQAAAPPVRANGVTARSSSDAPATVRDTSRQLQQQVQTDVQRALEQGAAARASDATQ